MKPRGRRQTSMASNIYIYIYDCCNIIISGVNSSHMGPMYIETAYIYIYIYIIIIIIMSRH